MITVILFIVRMGNKSYGNRGTVAEQRLWVSLWFAAQWTMALVQGKTLLQLRALPALRTGSLALVVSIVDLPESLNLQNFWSLLVRQP